MFLSRQFARAARPAVSRASRARARWQPVAPAPLALRAQFRSFAAPARLSAEQIRKQLATVKAAITVRAHVAPCHPVVFVFVLECCRRFWRRRAAVRVGVVADEFLFPPLLPL